MMIACENLVKIYTQTGVNVMALQGLDLTVADGEMVGIVGESGSGKSTLLNMLGGLDRPSAGKIIVDGQDLSKLNEKGLDTYRREHVGFVWQHTARNLVPFLTVMENVELPRRLSTQFSLQSRVPTEEYLELMGLADRRFHQPGQLSGGEQQRAAIAVALANHPALVLADEPTGELDTATARQIYSMFMNINRELGATILIVSHDPDISQFVGRVIAIRDGKTSTETVRISAGMDASAHEKQQIHYEELLMLDGAGRVQIPREVLEELGIGGRLRISVHENLITLSPVEGHNRERPSNDAIGRDEGVLMDEEPLPERKKPAWVKFWNHWFPRNQ